VPTPLFNSKPDPEHVLVRRIATGDAQAYRTLSERYLTRIHSYSWRLLGHQEDAEEVTQETFLRLWQNAHRFEAKAKVSTWLYRIAHNLAIDRLRKRGETLDQEHVDRAPASGGPSSHLERKREAVAVREALDSLAPRQRAAVTLVHLEGMSGAEAAEVMQVGPEALESLLSRGRRRLKSLLEPQLSRQR
jgi:RNA polymerase sigma-70 factor (ECF subfamily)